jgi:activator of 2-hydroxyglutaryl-CoA dehydratase
VIPRERADAMSDLVIGMDVGSTTVKAVVIDPETKTIHWHDYQRHHTKQPEKVLEFLERILEAFPNQPKEGWRMFLTGSGSGPLATADGRQVRAGGERRHARRRAQAPRRAERDRARWPGRQDHHVQGGQEHRPKTAGTSMNDKCASGTGATIDKCMIKVGAEPGFATSLHFSDAKLHHVAAKCGVFAETDIVNLVKTGIPEDEVLNSLADAIVLQNLSVLTRGNTLKPKVLLLGWPQHLPAVLAGVLASCAFRRPGRTAASTIPKTCRSKS